jgi:hypothetical protein
VSFQPLNLGLVGIRADEAAIFLKLLRTHLSEAVSLLGLHAWFRVVRTSGISLIRSLTIICATVIGHFFHIWFNVKVSTWAQSRAYLLVPFAGGHFSFSFLSADVLLSLGISLTILRDGHPTRSYA